MSLSKQAYKGLYPEKEPTHNFKIKYSGKFSSYNANVHYSSSMMEFRLSREWKSISQDIKIGLLQTLMLKVFNEKKQTVEIDLYNIFLKKVHVTAPKVRIEPLLAESFHRVNEKYFNGFMEIPNLVFGRNSLRKLGSYEYGSDTVSISRVLIGKDELIDYVMYHELLHKKFKYNVKNNRNYHHTREFRDAEKLFINHELMEQKLKRLLRRKKFFRLF